MIIDLTRGPAGYLRTAADLVGIVAQTRTHLARELVEELTVIDAKIRAANKQLTSLVATTGSSLRGLNGIGPSGAASAARGHRRTGRVLEQPSQPPLV
jgi:hypothetical protein